MSKITINSAKLNEASIEERARVFWDLDLADAENAMGVDPSVIKEFKINQADERVPRQGFVLNKFYYLPE